MKMNKFKYYIEMAQGESKIKEKIKITAVFYDKNKQKKRRFSLLHMVHPKNKETLETRIFKKDTDMTKNINTKLNALAAKLSEIKNNITEENKKIDNFKYKLEEKMENVKTEFQSLYDSVKKASDPKIKDSLEIEAIVKINDKNIFTITTDSSSNMLKIKKII
jgi:hypothetical protein